MSDAYRRGIPPLSSQKYLRLCIILINAQFSPDHRLQGLESWPVHQARYSLHQTISADLYLGSRASKMAEIPGP